MDYDHNKKFGLLKFYSGYGKFNLNSPKGYSLKIINAQTVPRVDKIHFLPQGGHDLYYRIHFLRLLISWSAVISSAYQVTNVEIQLFFHLL